MRSPLVGSVQKFEATMPRENSLDCSELSILVVLEVSDPML